MSQVLKKHLIWLAKFLSLKKIQLTVTVHHHLLSQVTNLRFAQLVLRKTAVVR